MQKLVTNPTVQPTWSVRILDRPNDLFQLQVHGDRQNETPAPRRRCHFPDGSRGSLHVLIQIRLGNGQDGDLEVGYDCGAGYVLLNQVLSEFSLQL